MTGLPGLPHARGGVSVPRTDRPATFRSSPRSWGCFIVILKKFHSYMVFPTLVGVFPHAPRQRRAGWRLPHARGGVSAVPRLAPRDDASSPRSWGCFHQYVGTYNKRMVFPTLVGVFLLCILRKIATCRLPHARGGVSDKNPVHCGGNWSSPRSWGCFRHVPERPASAGVFPTLVGVFLVGIWPVISLMSLPHARGGVSPSGLNLRNKA